MTFDGSTIEGYSRIQESDMLAKPDPNTFELLPGGDPEAPVASMFCDVQTVLRANPSTAIPATC
jgi:glutamine synthetase